jgi:predicted methyltransferase
MQAFAFNRDSEGRNYRNRAQEARTKAWTENFKRNLAETLDIESDEVIAFETDEMPEELEGTVDRVLIFRSMHGLINGNVADEVLRSVRTMLADDGMVGVVQHRAKADASWDDVNPAPGYVRQADIVKIFEVNGFEVVSSSEINANPKDSADWEGGVWALPPVLRYGEEDRAKYLAIGESDRMTLLFRKAD